jgi:ADP-heptose:LPS heptosyltransferase
VDAAVIDPDSLTLIKRVLVTRLRWLGDVVMSTPMLDALREALPAASIEYLTYSSFAPPLDGHPALDRLHTIGANAGVRETLGAARRLRRPRFDWCFDTLGNPRSLVLVRLIGPRHSVAPYRGLRSRLYEHSVRHEHGERSAVRHQLDSLTPLLGYIEERPPTIHVAADARGSAARQFGLEPGAPLALFHPGASDSQRAWPLERWPQLAGELQRSRGDIAIRVIRQPGWEDWAEKIVGGCNGDVVALPVLELSPLLALLANASLYVGNDGGILHCAVALRVPTVGMMGPTEDDVWFPYARWGPYRIVRGPSTLRSKAGWAISESPSASLDDVMLAVEEVLEEPRRSS